jgi:hypothetical protein
MKNTVTRLPYVREPFVKFIFGKLRTFENRREYKKFYYANRNKKSSERE